MSSFDENVKVLQLEAVISEKDEDIDKQSALILRLREQVLQLEESNRTYRNDNDLISRELTECQQENESLKELNVHLSEGIEQLARKYDEKCKEIDRKQKEAERLARQLHNKMEALILAKDELEKVKELNTTMKQSVAHVIKNLSIGCGFVDSYVRQILPKKESSIREKVAESIDIGKEKVYEDFAQPMEHADEPFDEELEALYNEKKELPEPLFAELKSALTRRNPGAFIVSDEQDNQPSSSCKLGLQPSPLENETESNQVAAVSLALQAAKLSRNFKNSNEECFGDDDSNEDSE